MGGAAATPTSDAEGLDEAPRNRSEAEISRSRRRWAYDGVSPTGARRDRSRDRPDRAEEGKRRHRSGAGAITKKVGVRRSPRGSPPARQRRAAGEVDDTDESLLSEGAAAEAAWPRSKTAGGGRARKRKRKRGAAVAAPRVCFWPLSPRYRVISLIAPLKLSMEMLGPPGPVLKLSSLPGVYLLVRVGPGPISLVIEPEKVLRS